MIGVYRVMQRQGTITESPIITHTLLLVDDEVGHAQSVELGGESETVVTTADYTISTDSRVDSLMSTWGSSVLNSASSALLSSYDNLSLCVPLFLCAPTTWGLP